MNAASGYLNAEHSVGEHRLGEILGFQTLKGNSIICWEMPLPFYRPKSTGRGKTICCFVGQYTCHALGKGIDKAKCEQRLSCLGAGGRVWLCFVPVANNSDGADFPACSG